METMNYNRDNKKNSKAGIVGFILFACVGTAATFYMIANEPEPTVLGQDMYIPTTSTNTNEVDIYSEEYVASIEYNIKNEVSKSTSGKFKSNIAVPEISIDGDSLTEINDEILNKFLVRYNAVKEEVQDLENKFTYKVTYNKYESNIDGKRILSFTFYERIIDDSKGTDVTYKLYAYSIDLATRKIITQDEAAVAILGSTYKTIIKDKIKEFVISEKLFTDETYTYSLTGLEEFYIKNDKLHIMFNPAEMGDNKDYLDITIEN
ncbi:MAG: hypothetical protein IJ272_02330 [Clostridia bacterium]|nr:hypothetical protein [Clostridia bacterium]